jgi:hypothetical protein
VTAVPGWSGRWSWESPEAASGVDVDEFLRGSMSYQVMRSMAAFLAD